MDLHSYYQKLKEQYPEGTFPETFPNQVPEAVQNEFVPRIDPNFDVHVSDNTVTMNGRPESLPRFSPPTSVSEEQPELAAPDYKFVKGTPPPVPVDKSTPSTAQPSREVPDKEADAILSSSNNDDARRQEELAGLNKRNLGNKVASFGAGIGDAISASASAFGGNAPGGFQQRLMERQDKQLESDKKGIEDRIRNDANSDISKQYQSLVAQFLQKDPKDPTILGLTANQIAEKIPQIEKLATLRQNEEMKRLEIGSQRADRADKLSAKALENTEKQELAATEAKQQADIIRQTIKDIKNKKLIGWDTTGPAGMKMLAPIDKPNLEAKLDTIKGNIAFDKLNKLRQASPTGGAVGQVSDKDMVLLQSVLGSLSTDQSPQELQNSLDTIDKIFTTFQGYNSAPSTPTESKAPATPDMRQTKLGHSYRKVQRNG